MHSLPETHNDASFTIPFLKLMEKSVRLLHCQEHQVTTNQSQLPKLEGIPYKIRNNTHNGKELQHTFLNFKRILLPFNPFNYLAA